MRLILWFAHSHGTSARERLILRFCSSGSKSETVVPSSTRPSRLMAPLANAAASASEVLPVPPWPRRTRLRSCSVLYSFMPDFYSSRASAAFRKRPRGWDRIIHCRPRTREGAPRRGRHSGGDGERHVEQGDRALHAAAAVEAARAIQTLDRTHRFDGVAGREQDRDFLAAAAHPVEEVRARRLAAGEHQADHIREERGQLHIRLVVTGDHARALAVPEVR